MYRISFQNLKLMMADRVESVDKGGSPEATPEEIKEGIHIADYLKKKHV